MSAAGSVDEMVQSVFLDESSHGADVELLLDWLGGDRQWISLLDAAGAAWKGRAPANHGVMWYVGTWTRGDGRGHGGGIVEVSFLRQNYEGNVDHVLMEVSLKFGGVNVRRVERCANGWWPALVPPLPLRVRICLDWAYEAYRMVMVGLTNNILESNCLLTDFRFKHCGVMVENMDDGSADGSGTDGGPTEVGGGQLVNFLHKASMAVVVYNRGDDVSLESDKSIRYF